MSDEKPFARCRQVGEEVCIEADDGFVVARFALDVSSQSEYTKDALNSAVAARERKAAAKALREAEDNCAKYRRRIPTGDEARHSAAYAALAFIEQDLRSRAAALEGGAT